MFVKIPFDASYPPSPIEFFGAICYAVIVVEQGAAPGERGQIDNEDSDPKPLFPLGQVVGTPGALRALEEAEQTPVEFLVRHVTGDWGNLPEEDKEENELSLREGFRIFSAYKLQSGVKVWVITEADRSATTILLPDEY